MYENNHTQQQPVSTLKQLNFSLKQNDPSTLSPFSTSPDDSDLNFSCEDLNVAFSQASINPPEEQQYQQLSNYHTAEDFDFSFSSDTTANDILLEMLGLFPDLPSFINSGDFPVFANLWFEYRKMSVLARHSINRPRVQNWLESAALQIHFMMVTIVKTNIGNTDPESQTRRMFSAFRRLKDHIEITHQVFRIIENGRVFFNQSPAQAIAPLIESAMKIKRDVNYFMNNHSQVIPVIEKNDDIVLKNTEQVTMTELSSRIMDTYNLMPYNNNFSTTAVKNLLPPPAMTTSSNLAKNFLSLENLQPNIITNEPIQPVFSHIQLSWVHHASLSLPVTPSIENTNKHNNNSQYLSLPTSPTCTQEAILVDDTCAPCNSVYNLSLSPYQSNSPLNTLSHDGESDYEMNPMDVDVQEDKIQRDSEDEDEVDEYVASDSLEDEEWKEESKVTRRRARRTATMIISSRKSSNRKEGETNNVVTTTKELRKAANSDRQNIRRTATSYDAQTTHYLKSMFFDIYSRREKLTKDQRRQVQKETGLKSRNITYWFSNHKRRFQNSLLVFKKTVEESNGVVKTYDDFLRWRKLRGLSEEASKDEVLGLNNDMIIDNKSDVLEDDLSVKLE